MKHPMSSKILVLCAALSMPMLAAAPPAAAQAGPSTAAKSARVIVKFKTDGPLMRESALAGRAGELPRVQHASRLSQRHGVAMRDGHPVAPRTQVVFAQGLSSAELVAKLRADPDVEYAEVDARVKRAAAPSDPLYGPQTGNVTPRSGQWYLRVPPSLGGNGQVASINAEQAWDSPAGSIGSPAIVVAVLDTGVRGDHPDLVGKLLRGYDFVSEDDPNSFATANDGDGRDADPSDPGDWVTQAEADGVFAGQNCEVGDSSWHGTQTTSLVAANTNDGAGMAGSGRNVRVLPVRVLGKCGGFTSDVIAGMYWAAGLAIPPTSNGVSLGSAPTNITPARVLNLSLGGSATSCSPLYQDAINAVNAAGATVVVSAGNGGGTSVGQPANCSNVIAVGGLRHIGTKSGFSDMGPQVTISAPAGNCPNAGECEYAILAASNNGTTVPATNTYSDGLNNVSFGTSFSAPMAAGVAALMLSKNPNLAPASVRSIMSGAIRQFPTSGATAGTPVCPALNPPTFECYCTTTTCGAGMLNAAGAIAATSLPTQPRALIFTTTAMPLPNTTITVDGTTSVGGNGTTINQYLWSLPVNGGIATLGATTNASTATITTTGEGTFTVRLRVTDGNNVQDTRDFVVSVANPSSQQPGTPTTGSGGGGGTLSWPWLLALLIAVGALRPRRGM